MTIVTESNIISILLAGNDAGICWLYEEYRDEFLVWAQSRYNTERELSKDIFQESVIEFYKNVSSGRLIELTSSTKSYLFQIGKFKLINELKKNSKITYKEDLDLIKGTEVNDFMEESLNDENKENLKKALKSLSPDCEKVLELYYFKEYDMDSIARELKYKNANTAKSKKSSCMKCLIQEMNKLSKLLLF